MIIELLVALLCVLALSALLTWVVQIVALGVMLRQGAKFTRKGFLGLAVPMLWLFHMSQESARFN